MASGSKRVIIAALIGNGLISITKFAAAFYTGSSAMLSEGIHSLVDTGNQGLLLMGMARSTRPADDRHPFGYGVELYFWAFIVAILIFSIGAGVSLYEGIHKIIAPHPITSPIVNYIVLGAAMVFEGFALGVAVKEFKITKGNRGWIQAVRESKDAAVFTVLFEDAAAMLGLIVAFVGILLSQLLNLPWMDGAASVMIGLILASTAIMLAIETKALIIGESASPETLKIIRDEVAPLKSVERINELRTLHRGPQDILLNLSLDFKDDLNAGEIEETLFMLEQNIRSKSPKIKRIFIEIQSSKHHAELTKGLHQTDPLV